MRNVVIVLAICLLLTPVMLAQTIAVSSRPLTDTDIQLLRSDLQSGKNQVIADTMKFTDPESKGFWPVYRDYVRDQQVIADKRLGLITDYAQHIENLDDSKAKEMSQRMFDIENESIKLREKYWPRFEQALGAKRAAKFYQVDNRLSLMINVQLASQIPLIP